MTNKQRKSAVIPMLLLGAFAVADDKSIVTDLGNDAGQRVPQLTVVPQYPEKARRARLEGEVEVCFNVDRAGKTKRVRVRRSTNRVFEKPSRDAARQSTYKRLPAEKQLPGIKTCRTFRFYLNPVAVETPAN